MSNIWPVSIWYGDVLNLGCDSKYLISTNLVFHIFLNSFNQGYSDFL